MNREPSWWACWLLLTVAVSLVVTAGDSVLLQVRRSYFTGGFLSVDHITGPSQLVLFLLSAFAADLALLGIVTAAALWLGARAGLTRTAALVAAGACALLPVAAATVVEYQILSYLGDLFDFGLMFDLAGRSLWEVLAVSWPQVAQAAAALVAAVLAAGLAVWWLGRRPGPRMPGVRLRAAAGLGAALLAGGAVSTFAARGGSDVLDNGLRRTTAGRLLGAVVNVVTDVDRDGFGALGRPPDPDLFDAAVRPYATEVPGNGIDENGVGGDLPLDLPPYVEAGADARPWLVTPDVVLIVLESFRGDALSAVVDGRPVTPVLRRLASRGIASSLAYSHNGYTVQSRRHIFSGSPADIETGATLVDDFASRGYETAYFSGQDESFGGEGQGVGFDRVDVAYDARTDRDRRYSTFTTPGSLAVSHEVLGARVAEFLARRQPGRPLFLYVNFHDTHFPYHHDHVRPIVSDTVVPQSDITPDRAGDVREMYLNTAANVDRAIGRLLEDVERALGHEPGVVVLADHGESLFDEGFLGHGYALNDAQTRIPLVVANLPLTIVEPFGQADLRGAFHRALSAPGAGSSGPVLIRDEARTVFQYLGIIDRAGAIGLAGSGGRLVHDVRAGRTQVDGGPWLAEEELSASTRREVQDLIHAWERMVIARRQ
jgi:hypothetical protein